MVLLHHDESSTTVAGRVAEQSEDEGAMEVGKSPSLGVIMLKRSWR